MEFINYCENIEGSAWAQFMEAMKQPYVVRGALMPDAHTGYTLPIGSAIATDNYVIPSWVGYDIGCGMCAVQLEGITRKDVEDNAEAIFESLYANIPVGVTKNAKPHTIPDHVLSLAKSELATEHCLLATMQIGTLGGGNHFLEVGADEKDNVWIVVHSGSRKVGHSIATHYMKKASTNVVRMAEEFDVKNKQVKKHNPDAYDRIKKQWVEKQVSRAKAKEGHYGWTADSEEGQEYIKDAYFAQEFAVANRRLMLERATNAIGACVASDPRFQSKNVINRNHNHVVEREIDGKLCYIHRKGATHAEEGMMGVIPANMRDGSFIVRGKGNPDSLYSSSHGAGRVLSRKKAKEEIKLEDFQNTMGGITALIGESTLDESPFAYKNIFDVMKAQEDLVDIVAHIKPIVNIKG